MQPGASPCIDLDQWRRPTTLATHGQGGRCGYRPHAIIQTVVREAAPWRGCLTNDHTRGTTNGMTKAPAAVTTRGTNLSNRARLIKARIRRGTAIANAAHVARSRRSVTLR
jgi:hypothetical protein